MDRQTNLPNLLKGKTADQPLKEEKLAITDQELYTRTLDLSTQSIEENFLDLGKAMRQLLERDAELFKKIVDISRLGSRKAYYLVNISQWFEGMPIPRKRLLAVGWTKLMVIGRHVTKDNVAELVTLAENNNVKQLEALMRGEAPKDNASCFLAYFDPKDYKVLEETMIQYGGGRRSGRGIENKEEALMKIIRRFKKMVGKES
jgi:hypothetical protein